MLSNPDVHKVKINVTVSDIDEVYYDDNERNQTVIVGVYNIDTGECFETIQGALDDPDTLDNHTILIPSGTYYENVEVDRPLDVERC